MARPDREMTKQQAQTEQLAEQAAGQPAGQLIDFGFEQVPLDQKQERVRAVFDSVASAYDLMNDVMSLGVHRLWKEALIDWLAPRPHQLLVDLAGGTGDIALRFLRRGGGRVQIVDINEQMLQAGRQRPALRPFADQISWVAGNAEALPLAPAIADRVTIAFGLRNVTNRQAALAEAYRILKPGGRFCCLEFSQVSNPLLGQIYDRWSFSALPRLGGIVAGDRAAYQYLVESIRKFPSQAELADMMGQAGFARVKLRALSGGIAAIHSGWKLD